MLCIELRCQNFHFMLCSFKIAGAAHTVGSKATLTTIIDGQSGGQSNTVTPTISLARPRGADVRAL